LEKEIHGALILELYIAKQRRELYMSTNTVVPPLPSNAVSPKRYHPALVLLHWLIALLIFGAFFLAQGNEGGDRERVRPGQGNVPPAAQQGNPSQGFQQEIQNVFSAIGLHMIAGLSVLLLLVIRLLVRWMTKQPEWASTGIKLFDWVGNLTHLGLYLLTFAMVITGIFLADQRGILARTFGIGSTPTPGAFRGGFSLGRFHEGVWILLILLIALHVGAALYHQFILKDNLLGRMWFGRE
jgi:cytochrome b561